MQILRAFRCNPSRMGEQRFCLAKLRPAPARQSRKLRDFAELRFIAATREIAEGQQTGTAIAGNRPAFRQVAVSR
jgi:hypothetical protein